MEFTDAEKKELSTHVREHLQYPASKQQLVEACNYMEHVPKATKEWFSKTLPERSYNSADEVIRAIGW